MKKLIQSCCRAKSILLIALVAALPVQANQELVDARQDGFNEMGASMKAMRDQLGKGSPDLAVVAEKADTIAMLAEKIPEWFPEGTGPKAGLKTDAREYIWENKTKFDSLTKELISESKAMSVAAKAGDVATAKAQLLKIRDNCSGCHDSFRVD